MVWIRLPILAGQIYCSEKGHNCSTPSFLQLPLLLQLNNSETRPTLIHNEITGYFTIDTVWWTLIRCFWNDEPNSALLLGLQTAALRKKRRWRSREKAASIHMHCLINFARGVDCRWSISNDGIFILLSNLLLSVKCEDRTTIRNVAQAKPVNSLDVWSVLQEAITSQRCREHSSKAKG